MLEWKHVHMSHLSDKGSYCRFIDGSYSSVSALPQTVHFQSLPTIASTQQHASKQQQNTQGVSPQTIISILKDPKFVESSMEEKVGTSTRI